MKSHFGVEDNKVQEVKLLIRLYPSMRFESNPYSVGGRTYFSISGEVSEFNDFQMRLYERERASQQSMHPTNGINRGFLISLWLRVLSNLKHYTTPPTCG